MELRTHPPFTFYVIHQTLSKFILCPTYKISVYACTVDEVSTCKWRYENNPEFRIKMARRVVPYMA